MLSEDPRDAPEFHVAHACVLVIHDLAGKALVRRGCTSTLIFETECQRTYM